jgi:hypothetical protein
VHTESGEPRRKQALAWRALFNLATVEVTRFKRAALATTTKTRQKKQTPASQKRETARDQTRIEFWRSDGASCRGCSVQGQQQYASGNPE